MSLDVRNCWPTSSHGLPERARNSLALTAARLTYERFILWINAPCLTRETWLERDDVSQNLLPGHLNSLKWYFQWNVQLSELYNGSRVVLKTFMAHRIPGVLTAVLVSGLIRPSSPIHSQQAQHGSSWTGPGWSNILHTLVTLHGIPTPSLFRCYFFRKAFFISPRFRDMH